MRENLSLFSVRPAVEKVRFSAVFQAWRPLRKEKFIMPKLKTHSGAKKRFNLTKTGKVKRAHAFKSHILTKKDTKRCRRLRSEAYADVTNEATIKKMIPYK